MKPILIFRHIACEGPGYLGEVLERRGTPYRVVRVDECEEVPESHETASGLVFMGGPMSVNDDLPWIEPELSLIRGAVDAGVPVLGHCLGGQLIARALGAAVTANPVKEIGWWPVEPAAGADEQWFQGAPASFEVFHWHGEAFTLPAGARRLLGSALCRNQAFSCGSALAMQCHVEMLPQMVREWTALYADELEASDSPGVQSAAEMTSRLDERLAALQAIADGIYGHWLRQVEV